MWAPLLCILMVCAFLGWSLLRREVLSIREENYTVGLRQNIATPKAQGTLWKKRQKGNMTQRIREFAVRLCLLATSEATPIKSHQHYCPNMSWTRRTSKSMPNWVGERPQGLNSAQSTTGNWVKLGARGSSPGKNKLIVQYQAVIHKNIHTSHIIWA